jgi:hypothetical protein
VTKHKNNHHNHCRLPKAWRRWFIAVIFAAAGLRPLNVHAHQSPNSLVFLDVSPGKVAMEIQMPLPELALAFGNDIDKNPETLVQRFGPQLKEYLKAHIHPYINKNQPWAVDVEALNMSKGKYTESGIAYWELVAQVILTPQPNELTRAFMLDYDVIMHQVINHVALVTIRSDWEAGRIDNNSTETGAISRNIKDNVIYPFEINLKKGSWLTGFKSMLVLGMRHIKEGTDHLLFIIVLLLPAMLLVQGKRWGGFGGTKYSIKRLLKIVTAFTLGHSLTLLAGATGWLQLPAQPVEILIAVSILISAIHAVRPVFPGKEVYVAAGFGLVHGLAFATVLSSLKLTPGALALSIVGFNAGIELMQLFIILLIVPWLILLSQTAWYGVVRVCGAVLAAIAALAWIAERSTGSTNIISTLVANASRFGLVGILTLAGVSVAVYALQTGKPEKKLLV